MKKIYMLILALVMTNSVIKAYDACINGIYYNFVNGEAIVTYQSNWYTPSYTATTIVIPDTIQGYPVTEIGEHAFYNCNVKYLTLPNTIRKIGNHAFDNNILEQKSFHLPEQLETIENFAFDCPPGPYVDTIYIHSRLRKVGELAFNGWSANVVYYYGTVEDWCTLSFEGKNPSKPWDEYTGYELYFNDEPVGSITIPKGLQDGLEKLFFGCKTIEHVVVPEGYTTLNRTFDGCTSLRSANLPNSVKALQGAFWDCVNLTTVNIPDSITDLTNAFRNCSSLSDITLPDSCDEIGTYAFYNTAITRLEAPHIKKIGENAFDNCTALKRVHLGEKLTKIGKCAFHNCEALDYVVLDATTPPSASGWSKKKERILPDSTIIYVPFEALPAYATLTGTWAKYFDMRARKEHYLINITNTPTSFEVEFGSDDEDYQIISASIDSIFFFPSNTVIYDGLDVMSQVPEMTIYIASNHEEYFELLFPSFYTYPNLTFNTLSPENVSSDFAVLLASTNAAEYETRCGFEIGLSDSEQGARKVGCVRDSSLMRSRVYGLQSSTRYKYRPYYESRNGNITYGEWLHFYTSQDPTYYDAILRTDSAVVLSDTTAVVCGYVLAGSEEIIEQGFEYQAIKRANDTTTTDSASSSIGVPTRIPVSGTTIQTTIEGLDPGTIYHFRTYALTQTRIFYGSEKEFVTTGEYVEDTQDVVPITFSEKHTNKILHDGQILILRNGVEYNVNGQIIK